MLDYSIPPLQFLIGSFDASQYLDSISLSVPLYEPGQALLWVGEFAISYNLAAKIGGLSENEFDEFQTPSRWRPYQQQVRLNIRGYQSPVFRIENYRYDRDTRIGRGRLTQIPTAVSGDRPAKIIKSEYRSEIEIEEAISKLIAAAFDGATVSAVYSGSSRDTAKFYAPLTTRTPWEDAGRLLATSWRWATVNRSEVVEAINGAGNPTVFSRAPELVEVAPDLDAIYQTALSTTVTGARQVPDTLTSNDAPRPKNKTTIEQRPYNTVFSGSSNEALITFEEKTIIYQYWDDDSWSGYVPGGVALGQYAGDINDTTQSGIIASDRPQDLNTPIQTITIRRQPTGYLYPTAGANASLTVAEVLVESNLRKLTLKPRGVVFGNSETALIAERNEKLTSPPIPLSADLAPDNRAYEPLPTLEDRLLAPTTPLKTETVVGAARLSPLGWAPILAKPLVMDFGYLPDNQRAQDLALRIAVREQQRRDRVLVDMPIPTEWLSAGWPLLHQCAIDGDRYLMDGCALSIADGRAKFGFTGNLVAKNSAVVSQPLYQLNLDVVAESVSEVPIKTGTATILDVTEVSEFPVGVGVRLDVLVEGISDVPVSSVPGTVLGVESVSDVPVSVVEYQVISVAAESISEVPIAIVQPQVLNITVSPSSQVEGSPTIQTLNITVSPSSQVEGSPVVQILNITVSPSSQAEG